MDHPAPPITHATSIPVTAYADGAEQAISGYSSDIISSFDAADGELAADPTINIYRFYLMTTGAGPDVDTKCEMQVTAKYEEGFKPHAGVFVAIFSPGGIVGGAWGYALDGPITTQIEDSSSYAWCTGTSRSPAHIPQTYTQHKPFDSLGNMQMVTAHEFAHHFTMEHVWGYCYGNPDHTHKSIEMFNSDPDDGCGNLDPFQHWHCNYDSDTDGWMYGERQAWTTCYNSGC